MCLTFFFLNYYKQAAEFICLSVMSHNNKILQFPLLFVPMFHNYSDTDEFGIKAHIKLEKVGSRRADHRV